MIGHLLCSMFAICLSVANPQPSNDTLPSWGETSRYATPIVAQWEGLRTTAYLDRFPTTPVWTICYGETFNVRPGETRTEEECMRGLEEGLERYWEDYRAHVDAEALAGRLWPQPDAAMTSLAWNIGGGALARSTALRRLNAGDIAGACEALTWFNRSGGRVVRGLQNRRADEYQLCMEGVR